MGMKSTRVATVLIAAVVALLAPTDAAGQLLSVTAQAGFFVPIGDYDDATAEADELIREREGTFAFGGSINLNLPLSPFGVRFSADYVTGSTLSQGGVTGGSKNSGDANTLYLAGDAVLTPLPRLLFLEPFVLVGAGYRNTSFDVEAPPSDLSEGDLVGHLGIGLDVAMGGVGIVAEVADFLARGGDGGPTLEHDLFVTAGVRIPVF